MPKATLTFQKHARGEYEIGMQTDDGAIVRHAAAAVRQQTLTTRQSVAKGLA
jgi:hypothetical protein